MDNPKKGIEYTHKQIGTSGWKVIQILPDREAIVVHTKTGSNITVGFKEFSDIFETTKHKENK